VKKIACSLTIGGIVLLLTVAGLLGQQPSGRAGSKKANADDIAAIKKEGQGLLKAYLAGDAKALAAHFTEGGEYLADDGTTIRGRAEIEKAYAGLFAKKKTPAEAEVEVTSIRFPSKDTAIEEGYFKARKGKEAPTSAKYTILHVREDGKWLMAVLREFPGEGTSLRDLEWLIGTWQAKRDDTEVSTTCEWWGDKSFLRVAIKLKQKGKTTEGFEMIGKDASTGQLRSWTFDAEGSFAEATWVREGNKWTQESAGVLDDGKVLAQTNILTRLDNDTFTFQSVERSVSGEDVADIPAIRVTRVKGR
jgi:uncharacterized protein (TIGR02246 family)